MYRLSGVRKTYQKGRRTIAALQDLDLIIDDGDWLVVQGPTGHGKTTLLQLLGGLDRPDSGAVEFDGEDLAQMRETKLTKIRARSFGFIFQTFNLIPTLTALENVEAALVPLRLTGRERRQRAREALEAVGLSDRLHHLPSELSGGQQQRVAIARALTKRPSVVLADEPTGNLDETTRGTIVDLLARMWKDHRLCLVVVTHDSSIAKRAPRVATISKGRLSVRSRQRQDGDGSSGAG